MVAKFLREGEAVTRVDLEIFGLITLSSKWQCCTTPRPADMLYTPSAYDRAVRQPTSCRYFSSLRMNCVAQVSQHQILVFIISAMKRLSYNLLRKCVFGFDFQFPNRYPVKLLLDKTCYRWTNTGINGHAKDINLQMIGLTQYYTLRAQKV